MLRYLVLFFNATIIITVMIIIWHIRNLVTLKEIFTSIPLKRYLISKEYDNIKSGDIIYTRSSIATFQELIIPFVFKHTAIIVKFGDTLYIAESSGKGIVARSKDKLITRKGGVDIYPLKQRLKNAIGPVFILRLNKSLNDDQLDGLQSTIIDQLGTPYPSMLSLFLLFMLKIPMKNKLYCYSFLYLCMINMKLIDDKKIGAFELGKLVTSLYDHELNNGYKYEYPRQLVYDYECEEELY